MGGAALRDNIKEQPQQSGSCGHLRGAKKDIELATKGLCNVTQAPRTLFKTRGIEIQNTVRPYRDQASVGRQA